MYNAPMPAHASRCPERFSAFLATEGSLIGMCPIMNFKYIAGIESLPTSFAFIFPLIGVIHKVPSVLCQYVECFSADFASFLRRRIVYRLMYDQSAFEFESLIANVAGVSLPGCVRVQMAAEVPRVFAADLTYLAIIIFQFPHSLLFSYDSSLFLHLFRFNLTCNYRV